MPRQLKEIRNFNIGNITNADPREVSDEGASFSRGIDPNAPNGILRGNPEENFKGGNINLSRYRIDTGLTTHGISQNNTNTSFTLSTNTEGLAAGDWISISSWAWKITSIKAAEKIIYVSSTDRLGDFGSTSTVGTYTTLYKLPTPKQLVTYIKDKDNDEENVIIFDEEGSVNGIENLEAETADFLGDGINSTENSDDFTHFPYSLKHDGDISIVQKGVTYFLGTGKGTKSKWLGKIGELALNTRKGLILEDSQLYSPDYGAGTNSYDKMITYQYTTTSSSTLVKMPLIDNKTGVFHVAFVKDEPFLYIIDGDTGFVNKTISVGFPITAIAKVVSCITDARIWLYEEIEDLTKFETNPGKIHCYELFDLDGTNSINLNSSDGFPIGIPLTFKHNHDCYWGDAYDTGYPSQPIYGGTDGFSGNNEKPLAIPYVSDILETTDSSGNGKLWILATPQSDENPYQDWFRTNNKLETDDMLLHRFIWSSYSNINGDLADGTTVTTYFNDKSMPLPMLRDCKTNFNHTTTIDGDRLAIEGFTGGDTACNFKYTLMKRSVPGGSAYVEPAKNEANGFQHYSATVNLTNNDAYHRLYSLVHGGSFWYVDTEYHTHIANQSITTTRQLDWTDADDIGDGSNNLTSNHNYSSEDDSSSSLYPRFPRVDWASFKPCPNSLVDLSDLYDGVDHVVGCVVKVNDTTNPLFLEDMWIKHQDDGVGYQQNVTIGKRVHGMGGKSFLWITNAGINNYGALYCKSNSFGYREDDGSDAALLDDLNLSTLCFDKNADVVRQIKVLGDVIPDAGITSISRNKATHEYNVFSKYNDRDSRFSGLFISYVQGVGMAPKGIIVRLNTTVEQGDTIDGVTDYNGNEIVMMGDHGSGIETGVAGYANDAGTAGSVGIVDNAGITSTELYPVNENAIAQVNGAVATVTNNSSLTVEAFNADAFSGSTFAGLHSGTPEAPNEVFPDGPGIISYFDDKNFFRKVWYNGSSATTLSNLYTEAEHAIADNRAIILRGENFQKAFIIESGPYEGTGTTDFPTNGTITKYGYFFHAFDDTHMTPTNIDGLDATEPVFGYTWPKGEPAKNDGTNADDEGRHSQYNASDYYFTYFNKGGKNNMYFGGLSSMISGSTDRINSFGDNYSGADFTFRQYINKLYQNTKYTTVEFTDGDTTTDEPANYPAGTSRYYKISYEYDGFQDSPLTSSTYTYVNSGASNYSNVKIKIKIPVNISPRVSAVILWRKGALETDVEGDFYVKVRRFALLKNEGWMKVSESSGEFYEQEFTDELEVGETYIDYTEMSESVQNSGLDYGISVNAANRLYVTKFNHPLLPDTTNSIAWSKLKKYSQFDVIGDRIDVENEITALVNYNNILFAFSLNKIYRIDTNTNTIIDTMDGFGCVNKDAVVSTEYGLFFADKNHIYHYDGTQVKILSYPVDIDASGSEGWVDLTAVGGTLNAIRLYFSSKFNLLIAMVSSTTTTKAMTYHILKQRWDQKRFEIENSGTFTQQYIVNNLLLPSKLGNKLYAITSPEGKGGVTTQQFCKFIEVNRSSEAIGQIYWKSKEFTMGVDNNDKRFIKIRIQASAALSTAPSVYIDGLLNTLTSSGTNEWKIKKNSGTGAVQKGKKIQVLITENEEKEIYSMGIIYRSMKVK